MLRLTVMACAALLATTGIASAQTVYSQPGNTGCDPSCWTSHYGAGSGFRAYDNFTLGGTARVGKVTWQGIYIPLAASPTAPAPNTTTWDLGFFSSSSAFPATQLYSASLASADVTSTFLGTSSYGSQVVNLYSFSATLPTSFTALAGTEYWFSPLSQASTFDPLFSWSPSSITADGVTAQTDTGGTNYLRPNDRAFSLGAVPEPAVWSMMILGFGTVGGALRRRKAQDRRFASV